MGLGVWVFGETFGGILAPGQTWLAGAPGAAMIYCLAGLLLVLPDRCWANRRRGLWLPGGIGLFWPGMALAQAWPGRGFWQGPAGHASPGSLASLVRQMVHPPQPHFLSTWVAAFALLDAAHGWAVNFFAIAALALIGASSWPQGEVLGLALVAGPFSA